MPPQFLLDLQDLDAAGKNLKAPIPVVWLRGALEGCELSPTDEPGSIDLRYSRSGTDVILHGQAKVTLQIPCARCLNPALLPLDIELSLLLVPATGPKGDFARGRKATKEAAKATKDAKPKEAPKPAAKAAKEPAEPEYEMQSGDADLDVYDGDEVALDPFLREAILLEVPPFPLCSEGCRGIAPPPSEESQGPSIDPRLAPLLKFKKQGN